MTSFSKPTSDLINGTIPALSSPQHESYFFTNLNNPLWIEPLRKHGLFKHPPQTEHVEGGYYRYPPWPASNYLARMAKHTPCEVAKIFEGIDTDNPSIIGDMIDAAQAMPVNVAVRLVPAIRRAAEAGMLYVFFKDAYELCARLANDGEVASAMILAEALFTPKFEEGREEPARIDQYWYKHGLEKVVPALAACQGQQFIPRLCEWLVLTIKAKKHIDEDSGSDFSYMWRPAIEEHEQNRDYEFAGAMVGFLRDACEQAIRHKQLALAEALRLLDQYRYNIFARMKIHLINEFAEQNHELARHTMLDRELFDNFRFKHEYARLVGHRLGILTAKERETWFKWIEAGPDMSEFDEHIKNNMGHDATDEDRRNRIHHWQYEKLHWVREYLDGKWRKFYDDMLACQGEPELADLNFRVDTGRWGDESPLTVGDLASLTFDQAVNKVSSWKPDKSRHMGPSIEGLASTFGQYIQKDTEAFSKQASMLINQPAIFVRKFISKMTEGVKAGRDIDIPAVLELCRWVIAQPLNERTTPEQDDEILIDKNWQWTRDEITQFLETICQAQKDGVPRYPLADLRESIWDMLEKLCRGPAGSYLAHDISKDDPRVQDYTNLAINSPRGKAVRAALEYARWVANHTKQHDGTREIMPGRFENMPEVREMLEWQIDPENRSVEALSIIGSRIGLLYFIDKKWLEDNTKRIFNLKDIENDPSTAHGWSAWNAFLVWVPPHKEFYGLFKEEYAYAVEQAAKVQLTKQSGAQPMKHLAEHLMVLYGRGNLGLNDDGGLLRRFISESVPDIRRYAIGFVGRSLRDDEKLPDEVVERFQCLWDCYWQDKGKYDAAEKPDDWLFGSWFVCGKFPEPWSLERLQQYAEVVPIPETSELIVERMASVDQVHIAQIVDILNKMIQSDSDGWRLHDWREPMMTILQNAMKTGGDVRTKAVHIINYLGRRGFIEYGKLLKSPQVSDSNVNS